MICDPPLLPHNRAAFAAEIAFADARAHDDLERSPASRRGVYRAYAVYLDAMLGTPQTPREIDARHADLAAFAKELGLTREDIACAA